MTAAEASTLLGESESYIRNLFPESVNTSNFEIYDLLKALHTNLEVADYAFRNSRKKNLNLESENQELRRKIEQLKDTINFEINGILNN